MSERAFRSMGCEVIVADATPETFAAIVALFEERDATFSRFRADSELARVNSTPGPFVSVSTLFASAVQAALAAARVTGGLLDPTLGAALEAAGYDADFPTLVPDERDPGHAPRGDWRSIRIGQGLLFRPTGTVLDLNGVVKAMAVDEAAALLSGSAFVSAGGDLATAESPITVSLPGGGTVTLEAGGIATSGTLTRSWLRAGRLQHHLIDPRTGRPSRSPWLCVTAVGRDCLSADVAAKAGFLLGHEGPAWLDGLGVAARFLAPGGVSLENARWARSLEREHAWA